MKSPKPKRKMERRRRASEQSPGEKKTRIQAPSLSVHSGGSRGGGVIGEGGRGGGFCPLPSPVVDAVQLNTAM